ncbi:MAG: DUF3990 domain-containing protein [Bacteroidales bacterium]|nr:DUF3990 domain-containing protein [Bacteroidales bacterium]
MKLYHGSTVEVRKPSLLRGRPNTDFGKGFYTTTCFEQAKRWAQIRQRRDKSNRAIVSIFDFDELVLDGNIYSIRRFNGVDSDWLNFVVSCRKQTLVHDFDIVMGPVANDRLYLTINMFENGELSEEAAILQLKSYKLFDQLSFHKEKTLPLLSFIDALDVAVSDVSGLNNITR